MNTEISDELKERALEAFGWATPEMLKSVRSQQWKTNNVTCSFLFNGVIDSAHYNVKADRFESISIKVAKTGLSIPFWNTDPEKVGGAVYCDEYETVTISIPSDFIPTARPPYKGYKQKRKEIEIPAERLAILDG